MRRAGRGTTLSVMPLARNGSVEIYYETFGDPADPTLVLVNGLGSQCINFRTEWCERFAAKGFQVVRLDNRDVGLSTHFSDVTPDLAGLIAALMAGEPVTVPYRLSDMAADVVAVLDALGVERAHVMGLSMGGMIVQTLAIEHPRAPALDDVGHVDDGRARRRPAEPGGPGPAVRTARDRPCSRPSPTTSPGCASGAARARSTRRRRRASPARPIDRAFDPAGVGRQIMAVTASGSRADGLRTVRVPTLVMHGSADKLIDPSGGRRTAELIPGARFVLIEGMGHDYPQAYWDEWVELVTDHAATADALQATT